MSIERAVSEDQAEEDLAFSIGAQAYVWGYPLVVSAATALVATNTDRPLPNGHAPFNSFGHVSRLFTAADRDVVSSNVDTVYSSAFLDLKQGAALLSVPDTDGRYYSLMLEDAFTNVFGYIGSRATGEKAGRYLIRGPGWNGAVPAGLDGVIDAPTFLAWIIGRTLVDGEDDLAAVGQLQAQYELSIVPPAIEVTPIRQRWGLALQPGLVPVEQVETLRWDEYFHWVGQLMRENPPPESDRALVSQFTRIGLGVGAGFAPETLLASTLRGLDRAHAAGKRIVQREALNSGTSEANGWAYNLSQGEWGLDFCLRAAIAFRSLGQNTAEEALYFNTRQDRDGRPLDGSTNYTLTFADGQEPPTDGFWSVTMYDASNFFVENRIGRYAIGNRTKGLTTAHDGSLTLSIQRFAPQGAQAANWLPAPEGGFRLSLRLYIPKSSVLAGGWTPPAVEVRDMRAEQCGS